MLPSSASLARRRLFGVWCVRWPNTSAAVTIRDAVAQRREAVRGSPGDQRHPVDGSGPLACLREPDADAAPGEHAEQPIGAALRVTRDRDAEASLRQRSSAPTSGAACSVSPNVRA